MVSSGGNGAEPDGLTVRLPATYDAPGLARREIDSWLAGRTTKGTTRRIVALVVSELVTNAVVHAGTDSVVEVTDRGVDLRIAVHDGEHAGPVPRSGGADGGFGLGIVGRVAQRWGWQLSELGKTVWAEVPVDVGEADASQ